MTLIWRPGILYDADALAYMELVKAADAAAGQTGGLEQGVIDASTTLLLVAKLMAFGARSRLAAFLLVPGHWLGRFSRLRGLRLLTLTSFLEITTGRRDWLIPWVRLT